MKILENKPQMVKTSAYKVGDRIIIKGDGYKALNNQTGTVIRCNKLKVQLDNGIKCWPKIDCVFPHIDHM